MSALETITRGNVSEVKLVLASVVTALAVYQVILMLVGYGRLRPRFLSGAAASASHRAVGDAVVVITGVVAALCVSYFEVEDEHVVHAVSASLLVAVLSFKIAIVRGWIKADRLLPVLGTIVLLLFVVTLATAAGLD